MLAAIPALLPASGEAHWADLAVAEFAVGERDVRLTLTFPTGLAAFADTDRDGRLSSEEVGAGREELQRFLSDRVRLAAGGEPGALTMVRTLEGPRPAIPGAAPGTHSTLLLEVRWPRPIDRLTVRWDLFLPGVPTASCLATILEGGRVHNYVFTPEHREVSLVLGHGSTPARAAGFLVLGLGHIFTGYDHILFLLGLLMLGGGFGYLVRVVTAFTVAHSLTLTLGVLGIVTLPGRWVESAIALSVVYVAAENVWCRRPGFGTRWLAAFGFGLVHGLGFASVLAETRLPLANLAVSLASFNVGVEVGQLVIVAVALGLLRLVRSRPWDVTFRRGVSMATAAIGLVWFVQRAFLGS